MRAGDFVALPQVDAGADVNARFRGAFVPLSHRIPDTVMARDHGDPGPLPVDVLAISMNPHRNEIEPDTTSINSGSRFTRPATRLTGEAAPAKSGVCHPQVLG